MKELHLAVQLSNKDYNVCAGELIDCLHNLKKLTLRLNNVSPEMESKLKTHGRKVRCEVNFE